jgi:hypothetical protein
MSRGTTCRPGQRPCASRRRMPARAPTARAAGEVATTRLPCTTTTSAEGGQPADMTDQSGQKATRARDRSISVLTRGWNSVGAGQLQQLGAFGTSGCTGSGKIACRRNQNAVAHREGELVPPGRGSYAPRAEEDVPRAAKRSPRASERTKGQRAWGPDMVDPAPTWFTQRDLRRRQSRRLALPGPHR